MYAKLMCVSFVHTKRKRQWVQRVVVISTLTLNYYSAKCSLFTSNFAVRDAHLKHWFSVVSKYINSIRERLSLLIWGRLVPKSPSLLASTKVTCAKFLATYATHWSSRRGSANSLARRWMTKTLSMESLVPRKTPHCRFNPAKRDMSAACSTSITTVSSSTSGAIERLL